MGDDDCSCWPWMKDAQPLVVTDPADHRPLVKDLVVHHRRKIDKIASALQSHPLYQANKHDDLWILRFYLTHQKSKAALQAAIKTLEYRHQYAWDDQDLRFTPPHKLSHLPNHGASIFCSYCHPKGYIVYTVLEETKGVVSLVDFGHVDWHRLVQEQQSEKWKGCMTYANEWMFQWTDYLTRTTGRLTKSLRIVDLTNSDPSKFNRLAVRRCGDASKQLEDYYPQLTDAMYVTNAKPFVQTVWRMVRPLLPRRMLAKMDLLHPRTNQAHRALLLEHVSLEKLPICLGGANGRPISEM